MGWVFDELEGEVGLALQLWVFLCVGDDCVDILHDP
jgi:hypothetical protein